MREFAAAAGVCEKTVRRWIRSGKLPADRRPLSTSWVAFRYELGPAALAEAEAIREAGMRRLSAFGPGLARHLRRRRGERVGRDEAAPQEPVRCPRCGAWLRPR